MHISFRKAILLLFLGSGLVKAANISVTSVTPVPGSDITVNGSDVTISATITNIGSTIEYLTAYQFLGTPGVQFALDPAAQFMLATASGLPVGGSYTGAILDFTFQSQVTIDSSYIYFSSSAVPGAPKDSYFLTNFVATAAPEPKTLWSGLAAMMSAIFVGLRSAKPSKLIAQRLF